MTIPAGALNDPISIRHFQPVLHPLFNRVERPPENLWIEGRASAFALIDRLPHDGLAVVGTRAPDRRALFLLVETLKRLRSSPLIILSGLARGIDSAAHEAALSSALPTIAILGCGIHRTYPPENMRLRKRILDAGGLVISEFEPDAEVRPPYFIQRNRLIAGFAKATWIVQSGYRSGALNTATRALKLDRTVYATPAFPGDPSFLGNENLLSRKSEFVRPLWSAEDLSYTWLDLFSTVQRKRRPTPLEAGLEVVIEIEKGLRDGKDVISILEERSRRTGESIDELLARVERTL